MEPLQQNILSTIEAHQRETRRVQDELFAQLRTEVLGIISGSNANGYNPSTGRADNQINERLFPLLCPGNCDKPNQFVTESIEVPTPAMAKSLHSASPQVNSPNHPQSEYNNEHHAGKSGHAASPTKHPAQQYVSEASHASLKVQELNNLAAPTGVFEGRQNLYAYLQAKNWDSKAAQNPDMDLPHEEIDLVHPYMQKYRSVINSSTFDMLVGVIILANSIVMGLQLEYQAIASAESICLDSGCLSGDPGHWPDADKAFATLSHVFAIMFTVELILRLAASGCAYFKDKFNWMDFVIVMVSILELYLLPLMGTKSPDMSLIRLMRVLRLVRVLRILRVLKFFSALRTLVIAVSASIGSLIWSMLLLGIVQLIASIFMTQSLQSYLQDETQDPANRAAVYTFFGSWSRSCITVFEMTLAAGTWGRCGRIVIFGVSRYYAIFFFGYLGMVSFGMIRVISAIFLKDTLTSAGKDAEVAMAEENRSPYYIKDIREAFRRMDYDGDDALSLGELHSMLEDKQIYDALVGLGVKPYELPGLFTLMDDGDNEISFCEFLTGIMRMKNDSKYKTVDLATLLYENKKLLKRLLVVKEDVDGLRKDFSAYMKRRN